MTYLRRPFFVGTRRTVRFLQKDGVCPLPTSVQYYGSTLAIFWRHHSPTCVCVPDSGFQRFPRVFLPPGGIASSKNNSIQISNKEHQERRGNNQGSKEPEDLLTVLLCCAVLCCVVRSLQYCWNSLLILSRKKQSISIYISIYISVAIFISIYP
jgi:hypothetical protein